MIPYKLSKRNKLEIQSTKKNHSVESAPGHRIRIVGNTTFWCIMDNMVGLKHIKGLVCRMPGEEILLGMSSLLKWKIIHSNFPKPYSFCLFDGIFHTESTLNLSNKITPLHW